MNPSTVEDTILVRLRGETRDLHQRLESELNFPGPELTLDRYREVLGQFYGFYVPWEAQLESGTTTLCANGTELRPKLPDLIADLSFFEVDRSPLPLCRTLPSLSTLPATLGSLYVREGSALGGQYISRELQSRFKLCNGDGYRFFSSAGRNVRRDWREFQTLLLRHSSPENDDAIVAAARETFDLIRLWLCES